MSKPPHDPVGPKRTDLTYNSYLQVPQLLSLQKLQSDPPHNDEMLFIIIHQAYELWFKLILLELQNAMRFMGEKRVLRAHHFVRRTVEIFKVLVQQIHILETMTPQEFLGFRDHLMPASGFQSLQFREVEFLCGLKNERYLAFFKDQPEYLSRLKERLSGPDLNDSFLRLLHDLDYGVPAGAAAKIAAGDEKTTEQALTALRSIYEEPEQELPLYLLAESLVDLDEGLALWREHHVRVVERIIGFKRGTGGSSGVSYLKTTVEKKCFPLLWDVRSHLVPKRSE
ncbi:MAG TPA: tryptophan 2,3-dioxygenase family protein [Bdellovibrionota bacterium]|nr:tryptophan 2,3-dioxygenase family protein [Bdellovibrionota bacterium]